LQQLQAECLQAQVLGVARLAVVEERIALHLRSDACNGVWSAVRVIERQHVLLQRA
jgi:hypothetical protein